MKDRAAAAAGGSKVMIHFGGPHTRTHFVANTSLVVGFIV